MAKDIASLVLFAFADVNPNLADRIKAGSVKNPTALSDTTYGGDILDADGKVLIKSASWKRGTFAGVMGLNPDFQPIEQEEPGDSKGVFKKADGSLYLVMEGTPDADQLSEILGGFDFTDEGTTIVPDENYTQLDNVLFAEHVPTYFIDAKPVSHVDLP